MAVKRAVAPYTGAWIEICRGGSKSLACWSLPTRERGLKYNNVTILNRPESVAPYTGAWIEILVPVKSGFVAASLPTRERGLKYVFARIKISL